MAQVRHWWRKVGGLVTACLLMALVGGPALDAVVCEAETDTPASSVLLSDGQAEASASHDQTEPGHAAETCVHGHCHHGPLLGLVTALAPAAPASIGRSHWLSAGSMPASRNPNGLERPPRA